MPVLPVVSIILAEYEADLRLLLSRPFLNRWSGIMADYDCSLPTVAALQLCQK